ncbi:MAG: beta(1,3)galactosyltransferase EpsH [Oscillospiraceae bacterium]|nr:beta(1,3)galactosyltransferase EpsH [Oscillospiraceae bacterium]
MILVLLGTQSHSFIRLLDEIEDCIENKIILEPVITQHGHTLFSSKHMTLFDFISIEEFNELIDHADLIITHGGVGSIINSIKTGKKVIAVPRLAEFNEHINDHQVQIVETFDKLGLIQGVFDVKEICKNIKNIDNFTPTPYVSNNQGMLEIVSNYINNN